jgi:hypothetical protein
VAGAARFRVLIAPGESPTVVVLMLATRSYGSIAPIQFERPCPQRRYPDRFLPRWLHLKEGIDGAALLTSFSSYKPVGVFREQHPDLRGAAIREAPVSADTISQAFQRPMQPERIQPRQSAGQQRHRRGTNKYIHQFHRKTSSRCKPSLPELGDNFTRRRPRRRSGCADTVPRTDDRPFG